MLKKIGVSAILTSDPAVIETADRLILPGVGAFDRGMSKIHELGLIKVLNHKVLEKKTPVLGICLGMQILTRGSEEGTIPGLGWVDATTVRFDFKNQKSDNYENLRVPHVGWNYVQPKPESRLFANMEKESRFYFTHSFYVRSNEQEQILATTNYGVDFVSAVKKQNVYGTQFHPEKSHRYGVQLLKNFMELCS